MARAPRLRRIAWLTDSGGLRYHWRALRHRDQAWRPFRDAVAGWLAAWQPPCERLVLVGPSAGHTLPIERMHHFAEIIALEPDALARRWLSRRARGRPLRFERIDVLRGTAPLRPLAEAFPDAAILFCNVLGQVRPPGGGRWHGPLADQLVGRHWASYHDVVSTTVRPRAGAAARAFADDPLETVLAHFWPGGELALIDHETFRLAGPGHAADYALWQLTPAHTHLIEWVVHQPPA